MKITEKFPGSADEDEDEHDQCSLTRLSNYPVVNVSKNGINYLLSINYRLSNIADKSDVKCKI